MKNAAHFINRYNPYRNKFTKIIENNLFGQTDWITQNSYLKKQYIESSIKDLVTLGFFITNTTRFIGLDIDDHHNIGEAFLLNVYHQVTQLLSRASILFKSPRGLHLHYYLDQNIPTSIITEILKKKLQKFTNVEIKPTQNSSLRIPVESKALDPTTLQFLNLPFHEIISRCRLYHPAEIIGDEFLPENVRLSLTEKKQSIKKLKAIPVIEAIEKKLLPLENGNTNEAFLKLCQTYRCSGLDQDDAFYRFKLCLINSPNYTGDLINEKRLVQRIKSEYKNNEYVPKNFSRTPNLFANMIAENVIAEIQARQLLIYVPPTLKLSKQQKAGITYKCKTIKKVVVNITNWGDFQDEIFANKSELAIWDYMYPFYRNNRKQGLYPLPALMMQRWNKRYYEILNILIDIDFLRPSGYKYNPKMNICKYYWIDPDNKYSC